MAKRINTLNTASSPANDDYLPIDGATNGTRKISADFINNLITDVEVDGTSVVTSGVAEIDLSGKQDTLTAGSNITIAQDGTISATDTTYTAGTNVDITNGVISATDTTYTAGTNVTIDANNVISASDTTYSAGTNVQINNGVISATDTTYSAFGGATAGADGSSGLVPQPLIADKDKFLKGDGTWDTIQPGASALDDLTNVDITSPTNGQVLKYDSANQEWVNANESGGGGGSTVTITPTLSTGTKIADYSIDGTTGALYAPSGGGGGSGDTFITYSKSVTTSQYGWWIIEDEDGNTLDPDTYVIIDISVNVRYYDVLWYQDSAGDYRATLFDINDGNTVRSSSTRTWTITYAKKDFSAGGGASAVSDLTDVNLTSLSDGQILKYDATNQIWVNGDVSGGGGGNIDTLWSGSVAPTTSSPETVTLAHSIADYDCLIFDVENTTTSVKATFVAHNLQVGDEYVEIIDDVNHTCCTFTVVSNTSITLSSFSSQWGNSTTYTGIYGVKHGSGGSAAISGTTAPTSSQGSNGDIYIQYKAGDVSVTIFSGTEHSSAYADPIEISVPNASTYNSFDITCLYYYWESQPIFDGVDSIDYADLESGQAIFMPSIDDPNNGVVIKLENNKFYIYPSTGYHLYVYEVIGHASDAPTKINHLYGKISNTWVESNNAEELTLPEYNSLTTAQKNDGTIRFIPESNIGTSNVVDTSNVTNAYIEGAMSLTPSSDEIAVVWNGNSNCGLDSYLTAKIDVTDYDYITYDLTTGNTYDYINPGTANPIRNLGIGLCSTAPSTSGWTNQTQITWAVSNIYSGTSDANKTMSGEVIDVSSLTGEYYFVICCAGWSFTIEDLTLATAGGNVSQIKYMSNTYAEVDVAEEMALVDYNALTTDQKNDGTIRFIPAGSGGGVTTPYDMSSISSSYVQGEMRLTATSSTETTVEYISGQQIGCNWNYPTPIDVTNISTIHFKATNGSCYGGGTQAQQANWHLQIGLTASAIGNQALNITASDSRWAAVADMPLANHVYEESIDVSELTGSYYLLVVAHGWNTVIEDITLDTGGAYPSQIKYMSKTYGESNLISYSTTEQVVGTWIDGSTVYEKVISISNVSLSSGSYETVDTITGLDTIISCNGYVVEGNLKYTLNDITLRVIQDGTSVKLYSPSGTTWTISSGAIIIRYTKASS